MTKKPSRRDVVKHKTGVVTDRVTGLAYLGPVSRVRHGVPVGDIRRLVSTDMDGLWGMDGGWSGEDVKKALVRMVGEGLTLRKALKALEDESGGGMPSMYRVQRWLEEDREFSRDMATAERALGEILADAALETMMDTGGAEMTAPAVSAAKELAKALMWRAARANRDKFGDHQKVEVQDNRPHQGKSLEHMKAELANLMADPVIRSAMGKLGLDRPEPEPQDAEVVETQQEGADAP